MKKFVYILILSIIFAFQYMYAEANIEQSLKTIRLLDLKEYQNLTPENIKSLKIIKYTEAGVNDKDINDKNEIIRIYNYLTLIKILDESKMSCTDNTTIYSFTLKDNTKTSVEIECNWVVIKGKNYNFKINHK